MEGCERHTGFHKRLFILQEIYIWGQICAKNAIFLQTWHRNCLINRYKMKPAAHRKGDFVNIRYAAAIKRKGELVWVKKVTKSNFETF